MYILPLIDPIFKHVTRTVQIEGLDTFTFRADEVQTTRPDIFQPGHFSVYDALVHLAEAGSLDLQAHFDEAVAAGGCGLV